MRYRCCLSVLLLITVAGVAEDLPHPIPANDPVAEKLNENLRYLLGRIEDLEDRLDALQRSVEVLDREAATRQFANGAHGPMPGKVGGTGTPDAVADKPGEEIGGGFGRNTPLGGVPSKQTVVFSSYAEGQILPRYGSSNMIVETSEGLGLTSASRTPANLVFSDFFIPNGVEAIVDLRTGFWTGQEISLWDNDHKIISVTLKNYDLKFGDHAKKRSTVGWRRGEEKNRLKITLKGGYARLYVNGKFFGVQAVQYATVDKLNITGINRDQDFIYAVSVEPAS
jgi:hypothetical protein